MIIIVTITFTRKWRDRDEKARETAKKRAKRMMKQSANNAVTSDKLGARNHNHAPAHRAQTHLIYTEGKRQNDGFN